MKNKAVHHMLSIVFLLGLAMAAYKYLSWDMMLKVWRDFSWPALGALMIIPALYLLLKGWRFVLLMGTQEEIPTSTLMRGYVASQSASLLPGGFAARSAILAQAGIPVEKTVGPVLANSGMDQLVLLIPGIVLAYWYPAIRLPAVLLTATLLVLIVLLSVEKSRAWVHGLLDKLARRFKQQDKLKEFQDVCWSMVDARLFFSTLALSVAANVMSYSILCVVVGSLGLKVEYWPLAAAFVIPTLLGRLSPLPAGAGVTEVGMVTFIAQQTAMSVNEAAAATALMRCFDVVLPALYGALVYGFSWKGGREDVGPEDGAAQAVAS